MSPKLSENGKRKPNKPFGNGKLSNKKIKAQMKTAVSQVFAELLSAGDDAKCNDATLLEVTLALLQLQLANLRWISVPLSVDSVIILLRKANLLNDSSERDVKQWISMMITLFLASPRSNYLK
jgi:hypothetical protein